MTDQAPSSSGPVSPERRPPPSCGSAARRPHPAPRRGGAPTLHPAAALEGVPERRGGEDGGYVHPEEWYAQHDVEFLPETVAVRSTGRPHELFVDGGSADHVRQPGARDRREPARADVPGAGTAPFRAADDRGQRVAAAALAVGGRRVVVVGSGWIGLEVAAAARGYGNDVTVVGQPCRSRGARPRARRGVRAAAPRHGVEFRTGPRRVRDRRSGDGPARW